MPYVPAFEFQRALVEARKANRVSDLLLLCEHPHVITLGRNGKREHLRVSDRFLAGRNVDVEATNRGGDVTYHGPGQIVGYPILDLAEHRRDVRWYVGQLEELMIRATADFGVEAFRVEGRHGVWVNRQADSSASTPANLVKLAAPASQEKLAALGVHLSRWVTSHGFAYNVSTDLRYFDWIVPCGISDARATSLERVLGRAVATSEAKSRLVAHFGEVFGCVLEAKSREDLSGILEQARHRVADAVTGGAITDSVAAAV